MVRTLGRPALAILVLLHAVSGLAPAQEPPSSVAAELLQGEPVRAYASAVKKGPCKGHFEEVRSDSLLIRSRGRPCALPLHALERVDRRIDRESDGEALLRGGLWGAGALGGIIYLLGCGSGECFADSITFAFVTMVAGTVAIPGAVVGSLVGVASPKEKWENVWSADVAGAGARGEPAESNVEPF